MKYTAGGDYISIKFHSPTNSGKNETSRKYYPVALLTIPTHLEIPVKIKLEDTESFAF